MGHLERELCLRATAIAGALLLATTSIAAQPTLAFGPFVFVSERGDTAASDTATLVVPMNRAARGAAARGATVSLPVVRFRSTAARPGPPIVYLSGGSGSGIAAARGARFPLFQALRELGDVVTFDLRGAGRSRPRIECPSDEPLPVDAALEYPAIVAHLRRNAARCAEALRGAAIDPAGFNVRETVADVDALRAALGARTVSLLGISTGSQIGLEYARRHPSRLTRAVLAGVQGPDQLVDLPGEQAGVLRELSRRLAAGAAAPGTPELLAVVRSVLDTLGARPATIRVLDRRTGDSVTVRLGRLDAQLLASATLGDRRQMRALPALFGAAARGAYTPLASFKLEASRAGISSAFEALQDCQTGVAPARLAARAHEADTALLGWGTLDFPEHCDGWGVPALDASWRAPVRSAARVLLVSGTLDGRTSVANAEAVLRGLPNGSHLVLDGASHGDDLLVGSPDVAAAIRGYLAGEPLRTTRIQVGAPR